MSRESELEQALEHIILAVKGSRTNTKHLARIQRRAEMALEGIEWDEDKFDTPTSQPKTPVEYEMHIQFLKRELHSYKNMSIIQRILFVFTGAEK